MPESGTVTGGCRCGAIRYAARGEPRHHALCHCDSCRHSAGAYVIGWALFPRDAVTVEGTPVDYASSEGTTRQFCGTCGTGMFYINEQIFPCQIDIQSASTSSRRRWTIRIRCRPARASRWPTRPGG